eukprot:1639081-Pyramimonas_sp.AAC.2
MRLLDTNHNKLELNILSVFETRPCSDVGGEKAPPLRSRTRNCVKDPPFFIWGRNSLAQLLSGPPLDALVATALDGFNHGLRNATTLI